MKKSITRTFLLAILINTSPSALWAMTEDYHLTRDRTYGWVIKVFSGVGDLFQAKDLLTSDEGLDTEGAPDLGGSVPLDGGVSLLLAAGAAYGLRRLRTGRK